MTDIPFEVQCKSTRPFFETIAAFDHIKVAYRYAQECKQTNPRNEYRLHDSVSGKTYPVHEYKGWGIA